MEVKTFFSKNKIKKIDMSNIETDSFININNISCEEIFKTSEIIKRVGILSPLLIRPNIKTKNKFYIFSNPEIFSALNFLQIKKVPAVVLQITQPEAALYYFNENNNLNIFEKAELLKFLTSPGKYHIIELCDILKISSKVLEDFLLPLTLKQGEKDIFLNRNFSIKLLKEYIKIPEENRKNILNYIVAKDYNETDSIKYIKNCLNPKTKPIKLACLKNDTIILNSMGRLAENLKSCGIEAETKKDITEKGYEYKLILANNPEQMNFNFSELLI